MKLPLCDKRILRCVTRGSRRSGFTLIEIMVASTLFVLVFASVVTGLSMAANRSMWSKYSAAANKLAEQRMEQMLNATWNTTAVPPVDLLTTTNFGSDTVNLETPGLGPAVNATRTVSITPMPGSSNTQYKVLQVTISWSVRGKGPYVISLQGIRAPDQ